MIDKVPVIKEQYLVSRLKTLNLSKKDVTTQFIIPKEFKKGKTKTQMELLELPFTFFTGDKNDNIEIHYFKPTTLGRYNFTRPGNKWATDFIRTRNQYPNEQTPKYLSPKGAGLAPFFPPKLLQDYINQQQIETLIITEGEFKAFIGCFHGFNVLGIPSIHGFYSNDSKGEIHYDIIDFITVCKVKNVIFLTDADTLIINYEKDKDLRKRQLSFYSAVQQFRNSLEKTIENPNTALESVFFSHIKTRFCDEAKGLDDLIIKMKGKESEILTDLLQFQHASKYFEGFSITDGREVKRIFNHFGLASEQDFYKLYKESIGNREFRFGKRVYVWDGEQVKYLQHEDTAKYMRIGADWMKEIELRDKNNQVLKQLVAWKIGEITRDYRSFPDFLENVPKYDGFCSEPDFSQNYKRVHFDGKLMNIYAPCIHEVKTGPIPHTEKFLKHIFGGEGNLEKNILGDPFTVALDYLTLQFKNPKQMLPVPVLVSKEFGTGKSTFLKWLAAIYVGNTAILNNDLFKMNFNSHYITKYIIAIDEGFLDVDKKAEKEKIKQLVTADTMYLQNKGIDLKPFNYYGKLIICSNDAENVMKMEDGEDRWFVIKVPMPKEKDPDLEEKLFNEIPAWLAYLTEREIFHPKKERFWFEKKHIITDQYNLIVKETKTRNEKILEEFIINMFLVFGVKEIKMNNDFLIEKINRQAKYKMDTHDLKQILELKLSMVKEPRHRYESPNFIDTKNNLISWEKRNDRPYIFKHTNWLSEEQLKEFESLDNSMIFNNEKQIDNDEPF